jgi:hypothetical protein
MNSWQISYQNPGHPSLAIFFSRLANFHGWQTLPTPTHTRITSRLIKLVSNQK